METTVIRQTEDAKTAEKTMFELNAINQQVRVLHFSLDPQICPSFIPLPDYACFVYTFRTRDIRHWRKQINEKMEALLYNEEFNEEIKPVVLKENIAIINANFNYYSLVTVDKKGQVKVLIQNVNENKRERKRPEGHAKADGSFLIIPK